VNDFNAETDNPPTPAVEPVSFEPFDQPESTAEGAVSEAAELAAEPEPEPEAESDPISVALERLEDRVAEGQRLLSRQTDIAAALHAENLRLKEGELRKAQQPLVRDVLRVHDDVDQMIRSLPSDDGAARDLEIVRTALVDALLRNGITPVACEPGEPFDPRAHKVAGVEPTQDPAADRTVAEVIRHAFAWEDGELLRVADVAVAKFRPAQPAPEQSESPVQPSEAADATNADSAAG
jgi:molecular chaperone GrpE (heat shock protein)